MQDTISPGIADLARQFQSGETTPTEAVESCLSRIEALEPKLGAFELVFADRAREAADAATHSIAGGHRVGPFHGVPFALKDLIDVDGLVTTGGSDALKDNVATGTATIARRLMGAGGVLVGKVKTVEIAYGPWGTNQHRGTPWNPWDMEVHRTPGGSSCGSGVSVAAEMVACAVGTDTGGSVRLPSAFCGLTGLKVTEGMLPLDGILPLSHTLDTPGPMCRSVLDAAIMFETMLGREPWKVDQDLANGQGLYGAMQAGMRGKTLGVMTPGDRAVISPEVLEIYEAALDRLVSLGAEIVEFEMPVDIDTMRDNLALIMGPESYVHHGAMFENPANRTDDTVKARLMAGKDVSAGDYIRTLRTRLVDRDVFLDKMRGLDALIMPTAPVAAQPIEGVNQLPVPSVFTRIANYLGFCALTTPMGLVDGHLPAGLQIIAPGGQEAVTLNIGQAFETDFGGIGRAPGARL